MKYFSVNTEQDYQNDLASEKIRTTRQACWVALLLFMSFGFLDIWALPSAVYCAWAVRLCVALFIVALLFTTRHEVFFTKHYNLITSVEYLFFGLAVEALISFAKETDVASVSYYAGLLLLLIGLYSWTFLPLRVTVSIGMILAAGYGIVTAIVQNVSLLEFVVNIYMVISANVVGVLSHRDRNRYSRENYLLRHSLHSELKMVEAEKRRSEFLALHDPLTGLPNRRYLQQFIAEMIEKAQDRNLVVAVLFIDLDGFKPINDVHGHKAGDLILCALSQRLKACARYGDITGRLGGDEFVVALNIPANNIGTTVQRITKRLLSVLNQPIVTQNAELNVFASIGAALYPYHGRDAETLIAIADQQMYLAKCTGKNKAVVAALSE